MLRSILAVAVVTLGLGGVLTGCGSSKEGPADLDQEMKFREKARGLVPGKAPQKAKTPEPDGKEKVTLPDAKEKAPDRSGATPPVAKEKATDRTGVVPQDNKKD
jgi:hypothetical protein